MVQFHDHDPKGKILIVDDSLESLNLLATTLTQSGYEVRRAINGAMALMGAKAEVPDVVLLDIRLPDMSGYEVCEQLKAAPETAEVAVIFLSALHETLDKVKAFRTGGVDYITKPFQIKEVLVRVESQVSLQLARAKIQQLNAQLEARVQEQTLQLEVANRELHQEIEERTQVDQALQQSELRFRTAIMEAPFPIMIHAEDGEVLQINKVWTRITGYGHDQIPTTDVWTELAYGERKSLAREVIAQLYHLERHTNEGEFAITIRDGSTRIWDFNSAPLGQLPDGRRLIISMAMDVTERTQVETALRQIQIELEAQVETRTHELAQANRHLQQELARRQETETALRQSEQRYRDFYNKSPVMQHSIDHQGNLISVSDYWLEKLGYDREAVIGRSSTDFLTSESRRYAEEIVLPAFFEAGFCWDVPYQFVCKNGETLDVLLSGIAERDATGKIIRSLAVLVDVTERNRIEAELNHTRQAAEAEIRRQLQQQAKTAKAVDLVVDKTRAKLNVQNIFSTVTREARKLLSTHRVVVYRFNRDWSGQFVAESAESSHYFWLAEQNKNPSLKGNISDCYIQNLMAQGLEQELGSLDGQADGQADGQSTPPPCFVADDIYQRNFPKCYLDFFEPYQVRAYLIAPIFQANQLWGLLAAYQHRQPRHWKTWETEAMVRLGKQVGLALQQADAVQKIQEQSDLVVQAVQSENQMRQAKEAADMANRAKSDFLAKMSHELRTPLNAILGFTQILARDSRILPDQQEHLNIISRSGEHLLALINDVLEMSKIEAGQITLKEQEFDLFSLLDGLEAMFQLRAVSQGLNLTFVRASQVPQYVWGDESKLRQVLINLLSNAIKFTPKGYVILRVSQMTPDSRANLETFQADSQADSQVDSQATLKFELEDTGIGIASEDIPLLFEPFIQAEGQAKQPEGSGLGLPISRKFVEFMGGELSFTSQVDQGSTFYFTLPIKVIESPPIKSPEPVQQVVGLAPNQLAYRILVVEDNETNRILLVKILTSVGFEVKWAENGQGALDLWQQWQPHLIWMDMQMPVMDGYRATQAIKGQLQGQLQGPDPVIIALTASAFEEERSIVLAAGCDDFVRKPFEIDTIFTKLAEYLGVKYRYQALEEISTSPINSPINPQVSMETLGEALGTRPDAWISQLCSAALGLDEERVLELIGEIPPEQTILREALQTLVQQLRFDTILNLVQSLE
jgi:two-component system sensor histidine kinase/response regulator